MQLIRVAAAAVNQTPLAWDHNRAHLAAAIGLAREQGASVLCLPELSITGYGCEDAFASRGVQRTAWEVLVSLLPETGGMVVSFGLPVAHRGALFDVACLACDGRILGLSAKRFLAGDGIHYEPRWFKPWPAGAVGELEAPGGTGLPIGDLCFDVGGLRIGFEICEDAWVAERPGAALSRRGVDLLLNPSASHFAFGKHEVRRRFVLEGSRAFAASYVYSNLVGNEAGRAIYDGGTLIASGGQLLAAGPRFSFAEALVTSAVIDVDATRTARSRSGSFSPDLSAHQADCPRAGFAFPAVEPEAPPAPVPSWEQGGRVKEEEFCRAVALGLFDYARKSRSRGFVVSLSGGADSSAVACLVGLTAELACAELGVAAVVERLGRPPRLLGATDAREVTAGLLTLAWQPSALSGPATAEAAGAVAAALGAPLHTLEIEPLVRAYRALGEAALGRPLDWEHDDLALQNLQARARAPSVWLLANVQGALLLTTSNRSEAAVGYATMDGDTCGGLAPLGGIDKAWLRSWLRWLETEGPAGGHPVPALAAVNRLTPTAELRPPGAHQSDEDDLMPYPVLDAVERAAMIEKRTPLEVYRALRPRFPEHGAAELRAWVERFFRLFAARQWKRERYAPSFHLDDESLDPRTWCRFPILSGGYERELDELAAWAEAAPEPQPERQPGPTVRPEARKEEPDMVYAIHDQGAPGSGAGGAS